MQQRVGQPSNMNEDNSQFLHMLFTLFRFVSMYTLFIFNFLKSVNILRRFTWEGALVH